MTTTRARPMKDSLGAWEPRSTVSNVACRVLQFAKAQEFAEEFEADRRGEPRAPADRRALTMREVLSRASRLCSLSSGEYAYRGPEVTVGRVACALANAEARGEVFVDRSCRPYRYAWLFEWERHGTRTDARSAS